MTSVCISIHHTLSCYSMSSNLHVVVSLQQYCDQIDQVEASVTELEQTAYRLDTYAKQLGECACVCINKSVLIHILQCRGQVQGP